MFFEGSEKKVEIVLKSGLSSLLLKDQAFWQNIVGSCGATIISEVKTDQLRAYLLSESSLFIWDDRITMITCGRTTLVNAILEFVSNFKEEEVLSIIFQRKNEYFGHLQSTNFIQDIERLKQKLKGVALRFGKMDEHHNYLFHLDQDFGPSKNDVTTELLMYHIQGPNADLLRTPNQDKQAIRKILRIDYFFPEFEIDDHLFDPVGYSLNAIHKDKYVTVHITPQEDNSYVSLETNVDINREIPGLLMQWVDIFKPNSFDIVTFNTKYIMELPEIYMRLSKVKEKLGCGYTVSFNHFFRERNKTHLPFRL